MRDVACKVTNEVLNSPNVSKKKYKEEKMS